MISSAAVQFIPNLRSLRTWIGIQARSLGCQETLSTSLCTWSQRCFCLMLRPNAVRQLLPYCVKGTHQPWVWLWTGHRQVGVGDESLVPTQTSRGSPSLGLAAAPPLAPSSWSSRHWGWASEQDFGMWMGEEKETGVTGKWKWALTFHLGSLFCSCSSWFQSAMGNVNPKEWITNG